MKKLIFVLLFATVAATGQTISPSQIKPGSNGQVLTTTGGVTSWNDLTAAIGSQSAHVVCFVGPQSGSGATTCRPLVASDILPNFGVSFSACSVCTTYEYGQSTTNPATFTLSYSNGTPASATISDGTNTDTLGSPYTSGSLPYSYTTNTTFTANATSTSSQTASATQGVSFAYRTFYGVGTCGATSATASGTSAVLNGGAGTLGTWGLGVNTGTVSVSPSSQCIYFLLSTSGHTFTVNTFATTFSVNSFTFTNQYSATPTMYLYSSPVALTGTYSVVVN